MSPLEISICLHYHSTPGDDPWLALNAPIKDNVMGKLVIAGLLERLVNGGINELPHFRATAKLHAYVNMLCLSPLPQQAWIDPRDESVLKLP